MPILRYFLFVGGTLLALLVLADAVLPSVPLPANLASASDLPAVRIKSARQWPERIVMDTSVAMPAPAQIAKVEQPAKVAAAEPAKTSTRDAFAQMSAADAKPQAVAVKPVEKPQASTTSESAFRSAEAKKRKVAKAHPGRPMILVAQQPHYGQFESTW
ncbi:hypothetical protein [Bradyrhizobium sp. HKCCYLS20291]|uniref:hypothetical protein n=1 Tax=Bradyrhizobium sp. HKCCYLS20291 TaxID=3420766 RepID=UPI003EBE465F